MGLIVVGSFVGGVGITVVGDFVVGNTVVRDVVVGALNGVGANCGGEAGKGIGDGVAIGCGGVAVGDLVGLEVDCTVGMADG